MFIPFSALDHTTISQQLALGIAAIKGGQSRIEFSQTNRVDSSAVVCILAWKRYAQQQGINLEFEQLPTNLTKLVELYGVMEFL